VSTEDRKYVRVYYSVVNDERFAEIYHDPRRFGTWLQLLLIADAMFPADAPLPAYVHRPSLKVLADAGLVESRAHQHFRMHGLASERELRGQSGRNAAAVRWQSGRNAEPMPRQDEHRQDKTSSTRAMRKPFADPLLEQIRTAQLATYEVDGPIVPEPTRLLTAAEQEREAHRLEALALHERFQRGDLEAAEYERLRADVGKPDDDLTRLHA
jgi:hypothetical protein